MGITAITTTSTKKEIVTNIMMYTVGQRMKKIVCLGFLTAFLISIASITSAKTTISPSIIVKEQYNDNIHLDSSDEEDDFITKVIPGVRFEYTPNRSTDINLEYSVRV